MFPIYTIPEMSYSSPEKAGAGGVCREKEEETIFTKDASILYSPSYAQL